MRHPLYHVISYEMSRRIRSLSQLVTKNLDFCNRDDLWLAFDALSKIPSYKDIYLKNIINKWLSICLIAYTYEPSERLLMNTYQEARDFSRAEQIEKECLNKGIPLVRLSNYR